MPSTFTWTCTGSNMIANVAYDLFSSASSTVETWAGDYELMIWLAALLSVETLLLMNNLGLVHMVELVPSVPLGKLSQPHQLLDRAGGSFTVWMATWRSIHSSTRMAYWTTLVAISRHSGLILPITKDIQQAASTCSVSLLCHLLGQEELTICPSSFPSRYRTLHRFWYTLGITV